MKDDIEEEPLDPAVEAIRQKMVRLLMVSGGIMMLGLMAVLAAIVYKINTSEIGNSPPQRVASEEQLTIPKGAEVIRISPRENGLLLRLKLSDGSTRIQLHDGNGQLVTGYSIKEE